MLYFRVKAALMGSPPEIIQAVVPSLQEELEARPHWREPKVAWEAETERVIIEVDHVAQTAEQAAGGVYEEIFEAANAVLEEFETIRVEVLHIYPIPEDGVPSWRFVRREALK